jgi:hypothetical protein
MKRKPRPLPNTGADRALALRLAAASLTDPRTVARAMRGEPVRPLVADRIRAAARDLGVSLPAQEVRP